MLGSNNSCSRCSHGSFTRSLNRSISGKVPQWCGCGMRPILCWSGTDANPERPFFGCPNYNTVGNRWCGLFVWANCEEEDGITGKKDNQNGTNLWKNNWGWRISNGEDEIRKLKGWNLVLTLIYLVLVFIMVGYVVGLGPELR
ncbi:hypothetical protein PIB30_040294 [Stylosanthes scabra]|uniref:Zinc finger GRF-type domain-containing protein n=1 Tax=Stylosanthes scabra TaxID=79078 RepID=A0ABU6ZD88_9FABA|nr:hypothetical protein [Stylosanthes scabra]